MRGSAEGKSLAGAIGFLTASRLIVNTSQRFVAPFLPAIARGLGVSLGQAGLLVSARWLAGLMVPLVVSLVGRGERRLRLFAFGLALFAAGSGITAASNAFIGALAGFGLLGIAKPVHDIASQAYVADRTPYTTRARALSYLELTWAGGLLVGAPLAGWLIDLGGWTLPFWFFVAAALIALLAATRVLDADDDVGVSQPLPLALDRPALALLTTTGLFSLAAENMTLIMGAWLENGFALSLVSLGLVSTVVGLAELSGEGGVLVFADRVGKRRTVMAGLLISIVAFVVFGLVSTTLAGGLAAMAIGLGGFEMSIVAAIPLATEQRAESRARFLALLTVSFAIGRAIGAAVGPFVFSHWGVPWNVAISVLADALALVVLLRWVHDH